MSDREHIRRAWLTALGCAALASSSLITRPAQAEGTAPSAVGVTPPSVLQHVDPVYPPSALKDRRHADVVLTVTVDTDGHVSQLAVAQSGGDDLDEAAIVAARQWTFVPAMRDGKPVASRIKVPFHFAPPAPPPELIEPPPSPDELPVRPSVPAAAPVRSAASAAPGSASEPSMTSPSTPAAPAAGASPGLGPPPPQPASTEGTAPAVGQVNVYGRLQPRTHGASDYQVTLGELKAVPRTNASDVLKLAPGFLLTNEGGSGHAEQVFLRGFDAHEGQDLEFTVDGVPINDAGNYHGNGYADTHFIIPELIQSVRVLEGPYAPQQGDFAVAGSADYHLGLGRRGLTAEYTTGNFDTQRLLVLWGPREASTGTFGAAEYYTTNGFGTNRQAKRGTAIGQYELPIGQKGVLRINATGYVTEYDNAGVVREDDYDRGLVGFYGTEDPNQTGNTATRASLSATYETRLSDMDISQQAFVLYREMRLRENWTGFLLDVQQPTQEPHDQRGDLIDFHYDAVTAGARGFARWHGTFLGLRQEFEGGYFARIDETTSTQDRIASGSNTPYLVDANLTSTLGDIGVYVDGNVHLFPWLALRGGVRTETFLFDVLNNCAIKSVDNPSDASPEIDQSCLSELAHGVYAEPFQRNATAAGAVLPRGTLAVGPFDHFEFAASIGDGVRSVDPSYVAQGLATPFVRIQSRDVGVSYAGALGPSVDFSARSDFFQTHVDQDLIFDPTQGRNTLASGSTRTGWAGSARALGSFFDVAANATLVKATFDTTGDCAPYCGLLVPYIPDLVLRADAAVFHDLPWRVAHEPIRATLGYGVSYVGRRPLPYGQVSDTIFLSDASVGLTWSIWGLRLSGQNLFNLRYRLGEYNYASYFPHPVANEPVPEPTLAPERAFTAGAPRTVFLSLSATLGGG